MRGDWVGKTVKGASASGSRLWTPKAGEPGRQAGPKPEGQLHQSDHIAAVSVGPPVHAIHSSKGRKRARRGCLLNFLVPPPRSPRLPLHRLPLSCHTVQSSGTEEILPPAQNTAGKLAKLLPWKQPQELGGVGDFGFPLAGLATAFVQPLHARPGGQHFPAWNGSRQTEKREGDTGCFSPTAYRWSCRSTGGGCFQRAFKCANLNLGSAVRVTIPSIFLGHIQVQGSRPGWDPGMGNGVGGEEEAVMSPAAQEEVVVVLGAALQGLLVSTCCSTRLLRHACRPGRGTGGKELQATGP